MKVLMYGWEFPPHISGGLGTACYGLTKGLLQNDVSVTFVVPKAFGDENTGRIDIISASDYPVGNYTALTQVLEGTFTFLRVNTPVMPYMNPEDFRRYTAGAGAAGAVPPPPFTSFKFTGEYGKDLLEEVWNYAIVAAEIAASGDFDVIHAHDWLSFPAGLLARHVSGKPLIVHVHATEFDRSAGHIDARVYDIERRGMEAADQVIAVSEFTRQIIIGKYHIPPGKVSVVHNGIVPPEEEASGTRRSMFKEKVVSYLGRVTYQKGPEYFIEAAARVLAKSRDYRFVMAGSGDMLRGMIRKAAALRITSHFHFTGFLDEKDVNRLFSMTDVYIMPSVSEPFGISPLEAARSGVPVILSRQSGVREVLKHAITVDFWDTDAMANAIHALARYKGLSGLFVRNNNKELQSLRWETQAKKVIELYHTLTGYLP